MSTKTCPQCGMNAPLQARFCGQCGHTFADPGARTVPTTVDEATADPPAVTAGPAPTPEPKPTPRVGLATVLGHPAVSVADLAAAAALAPAPAPAPGPRVGIPTAIGHAVPATPPAFAKTLFDPAPFGAGPLSEEGSPGSPATSQRPTPLVPPPEDKLGNTVADPDVAERAAHLRDQALAEATPRMRAAFNKTLLHGGVGPDPASAPAEAPPLSAASAPAAMAARGSDKQTMVGMPAVSLPAPQPPAPAPPAPQAPAPPAVQKTMIGVAIPGIAPTHDRPAPQPSRPIERAGTLLGVAAPGIAPLAAAMPRSTTRSFAEPPPPIVPAPAPLLVEPLPEAPHVPAKKGVSGLAVVGIVFALVAVVGVGAALVVMRSGAPLSAQPQLDEAGKESLKIRCESCPDGTVITLGASSAKVEGATTTLPLPAPLKIGDNDLDMKIDRPASGRDETVKVHVPVAYRVKADLSTLTVAPAAITVRVEALAGTEVTVDGKPVALDSSGKGSQTIAVASEVEGPSDDAKTIDRKIPFTIKPKGAAAAENGQLVVRTGVAPLHIDAPGLELFTDRSTGNVAGQIKPGGTVTIDGQNVAVDAQGRFGVRVELPEGEKTLTIVANAPPLAPRTVRAKLVRVGSLDAGAKTLDARTPLNFDAFGADPKSKIEQLAVIEGEIQEIRVSQGHTVMAVEEKKACSGGAGACVVRIVHGEEVRAARGDTVRAYGRIQGTAALNGKTIPDIEGSLVLARAAGKR